MSSRFGVLIALVEQATGVPQVEHSNGYTDTEAHFRLVSGRIIRVEVVRGVEDGYKVTAFMYGVAGTSTAEFANAPLDLIVDTARRLLMGECEG